MGDVARCLCQTFKADACPIHKPSPPDPAPEFPYVLTHNDRQMLKGMRIATIDEDDLDDTYRADLKERR